MENPNLDAPLRELGKGLENRPVATTPAPPPPRTYPRVLHHELLQIRRRDPNTVLGLKNRLDDVVVVLTVGDELHWNGAHPSEPTGKQARNRKRNWYPVKRLRRHRASLSP